MGKRGWRLLLFILLALIILKSGSAPGTGCGDGYCASTEHCGSSTVCEVDCGGCQNNKCQSAAQQLCDGSLACCGSVCTASCTAGFTNQACGDPGQYLYQSCSGSCPGTTTCKYDCSRTTCDSPPECRLATDFQCSATSGCSYPTPAPKGDACGSTTKVCDGQGSCSLPRCSTPSFCYTGTRLDTTPNGAWCDNDQTCQTCSRGQWDGTTCVVNICAPAEPPRCSGTLYQTCQSINNVYQWVTDQTCTGTCTVVDKKATCCTPDPTKCTYATTCSKTGTDNCGTPNSPICNRVTAGTCDG